MRRKWESHPHALPYTAGVNATADIGGEERLWRERWLPLWESGVPLAWARLRKMAAADPGARERVEVEAARREADVVERERRARFPYSNWWEMRRACAGFAARLLLARVELWARLQHNLRCDLREEALKPENRERVRRMLGGLGACERWWRRCLAQRRRDELERTEGWSPRYRYAARRKACEAKGEPRERATYSDGSVVPAGSREDAVRRAERAWREVVVRARPERARRVRAIDEGWAIRLAAIPRGRSARSRREAGAEDVSGGVEDALLAGLRAEVEAAGAWATEPLARKARVLPAVEVRPEELGWSAGMTGESEDEECVGEFAADMDKVATEGPEDEVEVEVGVPP